MSITLKAARVNNDLTLAEASEKLGVNINTLQNWETEKTYPDVPAIKKIEKVYGISFSNIFFSKCQDLILIFFIKQVLIYKTGLEATLKEKKNLSRRKEQDQEEAMKG